MITERNIEKLIRKSFGSVKELLSCYRSRVWAMLLTDVEAQWYRVAIYDAMDRQTKELHMLWTEVYGDDTVHEYVDDDDMRWQAMLQDWDIPEYAYERMSEQTFDDMAHGETSVDQWESMLEHEDIRALLKDNPQIKNI